MFNRRLLGLVVITLLVGLFGAGLGVAQDTEVRTGLAKLLPRDTDVFISIKDISTLKKKFDKSPYAEILKQEGFAEIIDLIQKEWSKGSKKFRKEAGFKLEDFLATFDGEVVFAVSELNKYLSKMVPYLEDGKRTPEMIKKIGLPEMYFIGETKSGASAAQEYMKKLLAKIEEKEENFSTSTEEIEGVTVTIFGDSEARFLYTQLNDKFVITSTRNGMKRMIKGVETSLADNSGFSIAANKVGVNGDLLIYFDAKPWTKLLNTVFDKLLAKAPNFDEDMADIIKRLFSDVIGLGNLTSFTVGANLNDGSSSLNMYIGTKGAPKGIFKLLAGAPGKLSPPSYIPENATSFSVMNIDFAPFWSDLEEWLKDAMKTYYDKNPNQPQMDPLAMFEQMLGFKINDLVDNLGTECVSFTLPRKKDEINQRQFIIVSVKDEEAAQTIITKIYENPFLQMLSPEKVDYKGKDIYRFIASNANVSIVVADEKLIVSTASLAEVKKFLKNIKSTKGDSIADNENYNALKGSLSKEATQISFMAPAYLADAIDTLFQSIKLQMDMFGESEQSKQLEDIMSALPDKEFYEKLFVGAVSSGEPLKDGTLWKVYTKYRTK